MDAGLLFYLMLEVPGSSEMLLQTNLHHILKYHNLSIHYHENLKTQKACGVTLYTCRVSVPNVPNPLYLKQIAYFL